MTRHIASVSCGLLSAVLILAASSHRAVGSDLPGDYNGDGTVDGLDFLVWQRQSGLTGAPLAADGNFDRSVDGTDLAIWEGGSPAVINYRRNADNYNPTGTNYGSYDLTDGSRIMPSVYQSGPLGGFDDSFYISAAPVTLTENKTFHRADAVFAAAFGYDEWRFHDDIRLIVWDRDLWVNGEPLIDNSVAVSTPLDFGNVNPNEFPTLFGGTSSPNAVNPGFQNLPYRFISGTFVPITLPAGDYMVGLLSGNVVSFEMAQSSISKTGNILAGDRYFDYPRWFNFEGTLLYETEPDYPGTLALDLYYEDNSGGYGATLASAATTVPEPTTAILALSVLILATGGRR